MANRIDISESFKRLEHLDMEKRTRTRVRGGGHLQSTCVYPARLCSPGRTRREYQRVLLRNMVVLILYFLVQAHPTRCHSNGGSATHSAAAAGSRARARSSCTRPPPPPRRAQAHPAAATARGPPACRAGRRAKTMMRAVARPQTRECWRLGGRLPRAHACAHRQQPRRS